MNKDILKDPYNDEELKRLIWEEWESEIKEEDPRQMVLKYMKLMREVLIKEAFNREIVSDVQRVCQWYQGRDVDRCERVEVWIDKHSTE